MKIEWFRAERVVEERLPGGVVFESKCATEAPNVAEAKLFLVAFQGEDDVRMGLDRRTGRAHGELAGHAEVDNETRV